MPNSFKTEVIADSSGEWVTNALRFATREEADKNGRALFSRWTAVREVRTGESDDPVNYRFDAERGRAVPLEVAAK